MFTDLLIIINDDGTVKEFNVHKAFLASASPYFESALFGPLSTNTDEMTLEDANFGAFENLLNYIYTDEPILKSISQAMQLYHLADKFLMENLKKLCRNYVTMNVSSKTVCQVIENFQLYDDEDIIRACQNVIMHNTTSIILSKEFEQISKETLLMILNMDRLTITSEMQLYKATERWFETYISKKGISDDSIKRKLFYEIIEYIRFRSIPTDEFPHSALLSKYMDNEVRQKVLNCLSAEDVTLLPANFSQKKREYIHDSHIPSRSDRETGSRTLPFDWKQRLQACVVRGDIKNLKKLIRAGADVNVKYNNGTTLLHIAAHRCKIEVVSCLLEHGLPVNNIDGRGYTALHIAALWGKLEIVQLLLERGADSSITNTEGQTPLDIANGQPHLYHHEIRDVLMKHENVTSYS